MTLGRGSAIMVGDYRFIFITNEQKIKRLFLKPHKKYVPVKRTQQLSKH